LDRGLWGRCDGLEAITRVWIRMHSRMRSLRLGYGTAAVLEVLQLFQASFLVGGLPAPPSTTLANEGDACTATNDCIIGSADYDPTELLQVQGVKRSSSSRRENASVPEIGVLNLFGYYYPTQPGDVNDVRTFCHVDPAEVNQPYPKCSQPVAPDQFGVTFASIGDADLTQFTFALAQQAVTTSNDVNLLPSVKDALRYLLKKPEVKAITCNVGFCAELQPLAQAATEILVREENLAAKPFLLGSPALIPLFNSSLSPTLGIDTETESILIITSFFPGLDMPNLVAILRDSGGLVGVDGNVTMAELNKNLQEFFGITCMDESMACATVMLNLITLNATAMAKGVLVIGWNLQEGYIPVDSSGGFHNVNLTLETYNPRVKNAADYARTVLGKRIAVIVLESTEMPAHANKIRMDWKVPVYDVSSVAKCLMRAAPSFAESHPPGLETEVVADLFGNHAFLQCVEELFTPSFIEPLFGTQADGTLKFYEGIEGVDLTYLTCTGGQSPDPLKPLARPIELYDQGFPVLVGELDPICFETAVGMCVGVPANGVACPSLSPGSGNCGGGTLGLQLNPRVIGIGFPCGANGSLCNSFLDVPPLNQNITKDPNNSNACLAPEQAQGFTFGNFSDDPAVPQ